VISEKPSVAQSIAKVLGADVRKDGCLSGSGYIVSWCFGHLVELAPADAYDPRYEKWAVEDLPIVPENWQYVVPSDKGKQLKILSGLIADKEVDGLICATDAGREGELIFRLVYEHCGCTKPVQRLWISSMEESAIKEGFQTLKDSAEYDRLYDAALCRARADWLVGINATRLFSVLYRTTLNVGRVQTPTLAMLVQREAEIAAFKKIPFYTVELDCECFKATGDKLADRKAAEEIRAACDGGTATVKTVARQEKAAQPPKLYDLTTLQRDANRILGYTAQQTLDYTQSLYEKKLVTYPRTDSRYLTDDMKDTVPALVKIVASAMPFAENPPVNVAHVIDSSKVSDHHAIIPTRALAGADLAALPTGEKNILSLIAVRLFCAVGEPHVTAETTVILDCKGHTFTAKGRTVTATGWKAAEQRFLVTLKQKPEDEPGGALPELAEWQTFKNAHAAVQEGFTSPPKHFTEDTLLSAMENAGAEEFAGIPDAERKGLGTPATRAGIIEKFIKTGFVERKNKQLLPTQKGVSLIDILPELIKSPSLTADWEAKLKQVEHGEIAASGFLDGIVQMTSDLVKTSATTKPDAGLFQTDREIIGVCPRCRMPVYEGKRNFYCSGYKDNPPCGFALWKNDRFFESKEKELTKKIAAALLKDGRVSMTGLYSEKAGKTYDAVVLLADTNPRGGNGGKYVNFKLEFCDKGGKTNDKEHK
jgi:DNA topoisomerase-3